MTGSARAWAAGFAVFAAIACGGEREPDGPPPDGATDAITGEAAKDASEPPANGPPPGLWRPARTPAPTPSPLQQAEIQRLEAIGYLQGEELPQAGERVTLYDPERAFGRYNLFTSGHAPEAQLVDMRGNTVWTWSLRYEQAFPDAPPEPSTSGMSYWRRAHVHDDGSLLVLFDGRGLAKLDANSELVWARRGGYHHDVFVAPDGRIHSLRREARLVPRVHPEKPVLLDWLATLRADGTPEREIGLLEAFERSEYAHLLPSAENIKHKGDIFHTNTVEIFDGSQAHRSPLFRAGNALVSMRSMNTIAILDPESETVVWAQRGPWKRQHEPTLLETGRILLVDNVGGRGGMSRVVETDPLSGELGWRYDGSPANGFSTATGGAVQRLPNGNTLVTESDTGRAFELTPGGERVWEFLNPERAGPDDRFVANLCEMLRLPQDFEPHFATR